MRGREPCLGRFLRLLEDRSKFLNLFLWRRRQAAAIGVVGHGEWWAAEGCASRCVVVEVKVGKCSQRRLAVGGTSQIQGRMHALPS